MPRHWQGLQAGTYNSLIIVLGTRLRSFKVILQSDLSYRAGSIQQFSARASSNSRSWAIARAHGMTWNDPSLWIFLELLSFLFCNMCFVTCVQSKFWISLGTEFWSRSLMKFLEWWTNYRESVTEIFFWSFSANEFSWMFDDLSLKFLLCRGSANEISWMLNGF